MAERQKLSVYLITGRVFDFTTDAKKPEDIKLLTTEICRDGYWHNNGTIFEHYPPSQIAKVLIEGGVVPTEHPRRQRI